MEQLQLALGLRLFLVAVGVMCCVILAALAAEPRGEDE